MNDHQYNCGIYKITNIVNGKIYIGQSVNITDRIGRHKRELNNGEHLSFHLQHAWNLYGKDSFVFERIFICPRQCLNDHEKFFIDQYKSNDNKFGYNLDSGGSNKKVMSEETKEKIRIARKNQKTTEKMLEALTYGRSIPITDKGRQKLSIINKNKIVSKETRQKISCKNSGKIRSEKFKRHISEIMSGENHPLFGVKMSNETKDRISKGNKGKKRTAEQIENTRKTSSKPIYQIDFISGEVIREWESALLAAINFGAKSGCCITMHLKGKLKSAYGYTWKYKTQ